MATAALVDAVAASLAPMWVEVSFMLCFALGFAVLRLDLLPGGGKKKGGKKLFEDAASATKQFDPKLRKAVDAEERPATVLAAWRAAQAKAPTPLDLLKPVIQAFLDAEPTALVPELLAHICAHAAVLGNARTAVVALDAVARAGDVGALQALHEAFKGGELQVAPTVQTYEVLLGGYATAGDEKRVGELMAELAESRMRLTARALSLTIKGFLKNGMVDAVLRQFGEMCALGFQVPPFAVTQLFRIACDAGRHTEAFEGVRGLQIPLPSDAVAHMLEDCAKRNDLAFAQLVESAAREGGVPLLASAFDALLKMHTLGGDLRAIALFEEMQSANVRISEGLCVGLLARCAEAKFMRFAEEIVKFARERGGMTIAMYSALMKVFAYCGMYDKACDLYERIREDGLEPDAMMYGCLMKFAVECGRTDLSRRLSEMAPSLDIQNYMSLIRAAGRDKDVARAFAVMEQLKSSGVTVDVAAYNCVLDVCVSAGDMTRARALVAEMHAGQRLDVITYNTLLKGYCASGDLPGARSLLLEMARAGMKPNDVSYNCIINAAVSAGRGDLREAWATIDVMEQSGVRVDHYTISIMMKALKHVKNTRDVARALALLDRSGIDVCSDEILLNTVLETSIRHRECRRLESVLEAYARSNLRPSLHTYGSLIKASSTLRRLPQCWEFWREMEERRGMVPNDVVLGCMLDALVCNQEVERAVELLARWRDRVPPNTIMYSTIIKGFANTRQPERAMAIWREMREGRLKMNTVVYNAVIDAQARLGAMDAVSELVGSMGQDEVVPDAITHSTIVKGYCVKGDLDKAFEVFRNMQRSGMANEAIVYNTILDGCTRHARFELADALLEDMERFKVVPSNFTLGILVKMYGRRHQLDKAFEVTESIPRRFGFVANPEVRTCLMCACLNNNALDRAFTVFGDLKAGPNGADGKAFAALISGCVRHGKLQKAVALVEEAYGLTTGPGLRRLAPGQTIDSDALDKLLQALAQQGLAASTSIPLLERLRAAKVPVSGRWYTSSWSGGAAPVAGGRPDARRGSRGRDYA